MYKNPRAPSCHNSECHHYTGPQHQEEAPAPRQHAGNRHRDNHSGVDDMLQRHHTRTRHYQGSQTALVQQQAEQEQQHLQAVDHLLNNEVRTLLEEHQQTLFSNGYHTGIQELTVASEDSAEAYVTAITLHVSELPIQEGRPHKDSRSISQIRFFGVAKSSEIQCQYMNAALQSKSFTLGLEAASHATLSQQGDALVQDFIHFILLFKRAGLAALR